MTASHPVFKPVTLPDFQNGNDTPFYYTGKLGFIPQKVIIFATFLLWPGIFE